MIPETTVSPASGMVGGPILIRPPEDQEIFLTSSTSFLEEVQDSAPADRPDPPVLVGPQVGRNLLSLTWETSFIGEVEVKRLGSHLPIKAIYPYPSKKLFKEEAAL